MTNFVQICSGVTLNPENVSSIVKDKGKVIITTKEIKAWHSVSYESLYCYEKTINLLKTGRLSDV